MNVLALDTSTSAFYAALKTDSGFFNNSLDSNSMQHSERIIPVLDSLLKQAGLAVKNLDLLVCTRGPGSFTGLRIAMSALKGISYGLNIPLVSVSTLEAWAEAASDIEGLKIVAIDAKKQRYYLSAFDKERLMPDTDGTVADLEEVLKKYDSLTVVGPDAESFSSMIEGKDVKCADVSASFVSALIKKGIESFEKNGADHIGQGPVYLRKSDAEYALEQRLKEGK
ncbi:MAG: tRNA (adenosine(37)-N6)-threonylcarbamoyltransferase complex dimerization subunit type 1 TsaB [Sphaerochaetaceae bacterium]|nr:tRNA (adenosine(37)-N6)-threonylcarbamoyltransferase complex dimerization subunit type 1 TsaB [Sphaerochaetaceae bacterium]